MNDDEQRGSERSASVAARRSSPRGRKSALGTILSAAVECFREKGFDGVSMSDVAARSGVSRQALYGHFRNKDALFEDIMVRHSMETWRRVVRALDFAEKPDVVLGRSFYMTARYMRTPSGRVLFDTRNRSRAAVTSQESGIPNLIDTHFWEPIVNGLSRSRRLRVTTEKAFLCLNYLLIGYLTYSDAFSDYPVAGETAARYLFENGEM